MLNNVFITQLTRFFYTFRIYLWFSVIRLSGAGVVERTSIRSFISWIIGIGSVIYVLDPTIVSFFDDIVLLFTKIFFAQRELQIKVDYTLSRNLYRFVMEFWNSHILKCFVLFPFNSLFATVNTRYFLQFTFPYEIHFAVVRTTAFF